VDCYFLAYNVLLANIFYFLSITFRGKVGLYLNRVKGAHTYAKNV